MNLSEEQIGKILKESAETILPSKKLAQNIIEQVDLAVEEKRPVYYKFIFPGLFVGAAALVLLLVGSLVNNKQGTSSVVVVPNIEEQTPSHIILPEDVSKDEIIIDNEESSEEVVPTNSKNTKPDLSGALAVFDNIDSDLAIAFTNSESDLDSLDLLLDGTDLDKINSDLDVL